MVRDFNGVDIRRKIEKHEKRKNGTKTLDS